MIAYGASRFLSSLGRSTALRASLIGQKGGREAGYCRTHPSTPERIAPRCKRRGKSARREWAKRAAPNISRRSTAWLLAMIRWTASIRGRQHLHPRLGFAFEAPEGFVLENSSQAVLGVTEGGDEALRIDSVRAPANKSLTDYLTSGWIDGLLEFNHPDD